jgi:TetR/AcrR family transcriptional regulator, cholesterol catabolism regulator
VTSISSSGAAVPAPAQQTTRAAESAARRQRLLDAAVSLATEGGYDAVQMRDVASRAQVALGTLYRHYSSKDQLLLAALADQASTLRARLAQRPPRGSDPGDRVADVLRRATRALTRDPSTTAAMVTALSSPGTEAATAKLEVYGQLRTIISGAIDGHEVPDLDGVLRILGYVWLATLGAWVGGTIDADGMAADLATAALLLLDERP